jgi:hypothetical protein
MKGLDFISFLYRILRNLSIQRVKAGRSNHGLNLGIGIPTSILIIKRLFIVNSEHVTNSTPYSGELCPPS